MQQFTIFNNLPLELRRKIWRHTLPTNRMITLDVWNNPRRITTIATLLTCHEARTAVLLQHAALAGSDKDIRIISRVDPSRDALYRKLAKKSGAPRGMRLGDQSMSVQNLVLDASWIMSVIFHTRRSILYNVWNP